MADIIEINIRPSGPIIAAGPLVLIDPAGNKVEVPEGETVALCRCGLSTEKPFCTGTHRGTFESTEAITRSFGS